MYRVYADEKHSRAERVIYRLIGADPKSEQTWGAYARSVLAFSAISILFLFIFQLVQGKLPLHLNDPATPMTPALAWNTAVSFATNTNWQAYSGESTLFLCSLSGSKQSLNLFNPLAQHLQMDCPSWLTMLFTRSYQSWCESLSGLHWLRTECTKKR